MDLTTLDIPQESPYLPRTEVTEEKVDAARPAVYESGPTALPDLRLRAVPRFDLGLRYKQPVELATAAGLNVLAFPPLSIPRDIIMRGAIKALRTDQKVSPEVAQAALATWSRIRHTFPHVVLPLTQVTGEGSIQMAWEIGSRYVDIEIRGPRRFAWFFQDRSSTKHESGQSRAALGKKFARYLHRVFTQR